MPGMFVSPHAYSPVLTARGENTLCPQVVDSSGRKTSLRYCSEYFSHHHPSADLKGKCADTFVMGHSLMKVLIVVVHSFSLPK
jgi:hypothetical protein